MNKRFFSATLAALMTVTALPVAACAANTDDRDTATSPSLNRTEHMQYMNGYADGTFRPDATITRAEACQLLASLLTERAGGGRTSFTDVADTAWYFDAVGEMTGFSLVNGYADGAFRPDAPISRAEFAAILARFPHDDLGTEQRFADVPGTHWAYSAVQTALAQKWIGGYADGTFRPDAHITRAEAVTMLGRVLGRPGDAVAAATGEGIRIMPDVPDTHWAHLAMLEATTDHEHQMADGHETWTSYDRETTSLTAGWHVIGGQTFHVNQDGLFDRGTAVDGLELDRNGRYTTGNQTLDALLADAASRAITSDMTHEQMLRAMYDYAKQAFGYLGINPADTSTSAWQQTYAIDMLQTGRGNCYSWSAAFTHLARKAGWPAKAVVGTGVSPKGSESPHAWIEIEIDGVAYTFDPQIESVYAARYGEQYDLFRKEYGAAEWGYKADQTQNGGADTPDAPAADAALTTLLDKVYGTTGAGTGMRQTVLFNGMGADGQDYTLSYFLGTDDIRIEAGLASEPLINVHAHSVVLARLADGQDAAVAKKLVEDNADPYKWVCVGVDPENVRVDVVDDTLILIMDNENAQTYLDNFRAAMGR